MAARRSGVSCVLPLAVAFFITALAQVDWQNPLEAWSGELTFEAHLTSVVRKALALGMVAALLVCGSAQAADSYRITAGGNQDWAPQSGGLDQTSSAQLEASDTMTGDNNAVGSVDYHLQAGPGIARASLDGNVTVPSGLFYPFNPSLQAVSNTELTVSGPEFELNTSLNLHVDGFLDNTVCGGGASCGALSVFVFAPSGTTAGAGTEFNTLGETRENNLGLTLDPVPGGYHVHGDVTSGDFGLRLNQPNAIGIVLNLGGRFAGNPATSTFGGSFDDPAARMQVSFAPDGPVLNDIPADATVSGAGVVNNRWDDPFSEDFVVTDCDDQALAQVTNVPGSLLIRALTSCAGLTFPKLEHIGGDIVIEGDHAPHVAFPGPVLVDGSVRVVGNDGSGDLDISDGSVGGAIDVSGNGGDLTIDTGSVGGAIDVSGNGGDLTIDAGSVGEAVDASGTGGDLTIDTGSVGGAIDVSGTGGDLDIAPGITSGDLDISENPDAGVINVGNGQIGGDLVITDDGTAVVDANDTLEVSGNADIEGAAGGDGLLDLSGVDADGDETVAADDADAVAADTAGGTTDVSILGGTAAMHVVLPDGVFDEPVAFTITRTGDEPVQAGTGATGAAAMIDPVAGYAFAFAIPALDADAHLAFMIDLAALDAGTRAALLAAIGSGSATIVSKADDAGSAYGSFAPCTGGQTPDADGCVAITLLAADGSVAPPGSEPAFARFDGIADHFSTYAVALLSSPPGGGGPGGGSPNPPAGSRPTAGQIRALLREQIVPHGRRSRISALLKHGYRLPFRSLVAGTAKVQWYRLRKGAKPSLVASGHQSFDAAGRATIRMKLKAAGRRQLRRTTHLRLIAKGTFTPTPDAPVTATRRFTLRR